MSMDVEFRDPALDRLETDATFSAGFSGAIVKTYRKRLQLIRAASDERSFYTLKSLHFEKLKGDRSHQCSMKLNDQWRLILELIGTAPEKVTMVVAIEDYH
jgi:toxin HigB-1